MPSSDARTWIDAPVDEVAAIAMDTARLAEWFALAVPVAVTDGTDVGRVGTRVDVAWRVGHAGFGHMTTVRRLRDIVHLDVVSATGGPGRLCLSLGAWNGGTLVELRADLDGWPVRASTLRRGLRRSARRLGRLTTDPEGSQRTAASPHGGMARVSPEHDAGAVPTS